MKKSQLRQIIRRLIKEQITGFGWAQVHNGQGGAYIASVLNPPGCQLPPNVNMHASFIHDNTAVEFATIGAQVGDYINVISTNQQHQCVRILEIINEQDFNNASIALPPNTPPTAPGYNTPPGFFDLTQTVPYSWPSQGLINVHRFADCNNCLTFVNGQVPGCTDINANNFDPLATVDDGSCTYDDTYNCDSNNQCQINTTGTGQYQTLSACQAVCVAPPIESYNCSIDKFGNTSCTDPGDGSGQYLTLQNCQEGCVRHSVSNDDRAGDENPRISFDCKVDKFGNTSCIDPYTGNGEYSTLAACQAGCEGPTQISNDDRFVDNPVDPNVCNAIMTLNNHDPINHSGNISIEFSGPIRYAFNLKGPDPTGNINTLMSSGPMMGPTLNYNGPINTGIYTLDYECGLNNTSNITLPLQTTLTVS
jgi:hypothetical protein